MSEQMYKQQTQSGRSKRLREHQTEQQHTEVDHAGRERLAQLDAALDEYLAQTATENDTAAVGLPQAHLRNQPISNETLVRGFRQTIGE